MPILRKQPAFRDATSGFRAKSTSEKRAQKFYTDDLDSAMFAMQSVFTLIKTLCRKEMGETTAEEFKMSTQYG